MQELMNEIAGNAPDGSGKRKKGLEMSKSDENMKPFGYPLPPSASSDRSTLI